MNPPRIGIICGMASERDALGPLARDPRVMAAISGARPARVEVQAGRLVAEGCTLLVSWGLAGGLAPGLRPGDLVIPRHVVSEAGETWTLAPCPAPLAPLASAQPDRLLGLERVALNPAEKAKLAAASGAAAVDMESHRVARAGAAAGVPVIVIRAIGDPAERALPALAAKAIGKDGRPRILNVILGLLRRPGDLPDLLHAKRDSDAALTTLSHTAALLETAFATAR